MTLAIPSQRVNAELRWQTDGSKQVHDDWSYVIGAGVYNAARGNSHSINPRGSGATNTITRAELAASALLFMGQGQDEITATDSQASICVIADAIYGLSTNPAAMQTHGHAGGHSSSTSCPSKKGPANQNSESEIPYLNSGKRGGQ